MWTINKSLTQKKPKDVCPALPKCGLHIVTDFQKVQYGKERETELHNGEN